MYILDFSRSVIGFPFKAVWLAFRRNKHTHIYIMAYLDLFLSTPVNEFIFFKKDRQTTKKGNPIPIGRNPICTSSFGQYVCFVNLYIHQSSKTQTTESKYGLKTSRYQNIQRAYTFLPKNKNVPKYIHMFQSNRYQVLKMVVLIIKRL